MFEVQLPVFQGPLELLLHLIEKRQLDITTLSLIEVTEQYMEHVRSAEQIDLAALADFLVIGAKLLFLKSASLLPRPPAQEMEEDEEDGNELTYLLEEYRKFRDAAQSLRERGDLGLRAYPRLAPLAKPEARPAPLDLALPDLLKALERVLERTAGEDLPSVERRKVTVAERMQLLRTRLDSGQTVTFGSFVADCLSRESVVVSFLSVLELVKAKEVEVHQESLFGEIFILPARKESHHAQTV